MSVATPTRRTSLPLLLRRVREGGRIAMLAVSHATGGSWGAAGRDEGGL